MTKIKCSSHIECDVISRNYRKFLDVLTLLENFVYQQCNNKIHWALFFKSLHKQTSSLKSIFYLQKYIHNYFLKIKYLLWTEMLQIQMSKVTALDYASWTWQKTKLSDFLLRKKFKFLKRRSVWKINDWSEWQMIQISFIKELWLYLRKKYNRTY